jgi:hypothetical protein
LTKGMPPPGCFGRAMAEPLDGEGEESFDIFVCTPKWLIERYKAVDVPLGLHKIIVFEYDHRRLREFIEKFLMRARVRTGTKSQER